MRSRYPHSQEINSLFFPPAWVQGALSNDKKQKTYYNFAQHATSTIKITEKHTQRLRLLRRLHRKHGRSSLILRLRCAGR